MTIQRWRCEKYEHLGELRKGAALAAAEASVTRAFDAQNYALAAKRCPRWGEIRRSGAWAKKFASVNKLGDLAFYVPATPVEVTRMEKRL